jgi:hypothetical protein
LYTFDGAGGFTARAAFNFSGGNIFNADWSLNPLFTGTYTVNADGTGTMTWEPDPSPQLRDRRWRKRA